MSRDEEDKGGIEDDLEERDTLLVPFPRASLTDDESDTEVVANDADEAKDADKSDAPLDSATREAPRPLTDEERRVNAAWRLRLMGGPTFRKDYTPTKGERKEMENIIELLALKNPRQHPDYLEDTEDQITRNAISSILFADPSEPQSVLLKRGPVLLGGEERELMVFTGGCLFSRVEIDSLVNMLLDVTLEQWTERFHDIDTGHSGSLDRFEIRDFFQGTGMTLSDASLDGIMKRFDSDSDGTISLKKFKSLFYKSHRASQAEGSVWKSLGAKLRRNRERTSIHGKLDAAFRMADIKKIENIGICYGNNTAFSLDTEWGTSTLALHVKGETEPVLVTCAKPGHAEAWMEAFRTCMKSFKSHCAVERPRSREPPSQVQRSHPGLINGLENAPVERTKKDRTSRIKWTASSIVWGDDDETDEYGEDGL